MKNRCFFLILVCLVTCQGNLFGQGSNVTDFWQLASPDVPFGVSCSAVSPNGTIYAISNGLFRSQDNGFTWERLKVGANNLSQTALAANSRGHIYVGNNDDNNLYRSSDDGQTWQALKVGTLRCDVYHIFISPEDHIFVTTPWANGPHCYRSDDDGLHWTPLHDDLSCFAFFNGMTYAVTDQDSVLVSANYGMTWTFLSKLTESDVIRILDLQINSKGTIFVTFLFSFEDRVATALARSNDGGLTWKELDGAGGYLAIDQFDNLYCQWCQLFRSIDDGDHLTIITPTESLGNGISFILDHEQNLLSFQFHIYRSTDKGDTWTRIQTNFTSDEHHILFEPDGTILVGMGPFVARSFDNSQTWSVFTIDDNKPNLKVCALVRYSNDNLYLATNNNGIYRSTDHSESWQRLNTGITDSTFSKLTIGTNGRIYAAGNNTLECYLYTSDDSGNTWKRKIIDQHHAFVIAGLISPGDDNDVLVASGHGYDSVYGVLYRSLDGGDNWYSEEVNVAPYIMDVMYDQRSDYFFLTTSSGLYRRGRMEFISPWEKVKNGLPSLSSGLIGDVITVPDGLFLSCLDQTQNIHDFYYSFDRGDNWSQITNNAAYPNWIQIPREMALHPSGHLYVSADVDEMIARNLFRSRNPISFPTQFNSANIASNAASYGVSWADYNNDGHEDLFLANEGPNHLYRNNDNGAFTQITSGAIATDNEPSRCATCGDYDNDGFIDVFVANENAANSLYHNNGNGTFTKITGQPLTTEVFASRAAAWADYNRDGFLDLFIAVVNGNNLLYKNNGNGTFTRITTGAIVNDGGASYGCTWADYDLDGDADLFVANYGNNFLYRNNGDDSFSKITTGPVVTDGGNSFGGSWGDYDYDGYLDLCVTNTEGVNFLYHNAGDGTFIRILDGVIATDTGISKGSAWADINNDGWLDLYVARNGADALYLNTGGNGFTRLNTSYFSLADNSLACAWSDPNRDGFLDLLVANYNVQTSLFLNAGSTSHWTEVKCVGSVSNRSAIGTLVQIKANIRGQMVWQSREISSQSGHSGQNSLVAHFGLGDASLIDSLRIVWPSGQVQVIAGVMADDYLTIIEPAVVPVELASFTACSEDGKIVLHWRTLSQQNNYGFEIERKCEHETWRKIGFVPGQGSTAAANEYVFTDENLINAGEYDYRLKIIDRDGQYEYSPVVQISFGLPVTYELKQNYPNPFNPTTLIRYALPRDEQVKLEVCDMLGRMVMTMVNERQQAGYHEAVFRPIGLASGVYFYRLQVGAFFAKRKMLLMR